MKSPPILKEVFFMQRNQLSATVVATITGVHRPKTAASAMHDGDGR